MIQDVIKAIDYLVDDIYSIDQVNINQLFLNLIDNLLKFIQNMEMRGYHINIDEEANLLQNAFSGKDYTKLADVLLYNLKPEFVKLEKELEF